MGAGSQQFLPGLGSIHIEVSDVATSMVLQELRQSQSHVTPPVLVCTAQVHTRIPGLNSGCSTRIFFSAANFCRASY